MNNIPGQFISFETFLPLANTNELSQAQESNCGLNENSQGTKRKRAASSSAAKRQKQQSKVNQEFNELGFVLLF